MRYSEIFSAASLIAEEKRLLFARRVDENVLHLAFESGDWLFDLSPSQTLIAPVKPLWHKKSYSAPFDLALNRRLNAAELLNASVEEGDKIVRLEFMKADRYKEIRTALILELLPVKSNALIVDEGGVLLESLRRIRKNGVPYVLPPKPPYAPVAKPIENLRAVLIGRYNDLRRRELAEKKEFALRKARQKVARLEGTLEALESPDRLEKRADLARREGELLLANANTISPFVREAVVDDFDGRCRVIALESLPTAAREAERKFLLSKRLRAKAAGLKTQRESLRDRVLFYARLISAINGAKDSGELSAVLPQKPLKEKDIPHGEPIERFAIGGFSVLLGRSEKGNALLLKRAKAGDLWFHIKGMPGAHVIVQTRREKLPAGIITEAARLCARFSVSSGGAFEVDYTARRNVRIVKGAEVTYTDYKTVRIGLD
ncbi:MAG: NFACT RNA binding domain-containing protein [Helicobacteraceae bacterium]|jgi:predicted ribosome quality control (RQC) complex YloA/Tae2 family protein|nr:NFACT RNA binding domain-containing protein [Helicobacteraceae bacterium]